MQPKCEKFSDSFPSQRFAALLPLFIFVGLCLLSAALPGVLFGQIAEVTNITSTPIAGSGHDYLHDLSEIVNPANGSVSIRIAAPTPHERRAESPIYAYMYDTNGQFIVTFEGQVQPIGGGEELLVLGPNFSVPATTGGNFTGSFGAGSVSYQKTAFSYCSSPTGTGGCGTTIYCTYQGGFVATDPSGGRHTLGVGFEINGGQSPEDCVSVGVNLGNAGGDEQYKIDTTTGGDLVVDLHGDALVAGLEDTNGNYLNTDGRPWSASYSYVCTPWFPCPTSMTFPGLSAPYTYGSQSGTSGTWYASSTSLNATLRYNNGADIGYAGNCNDLTLSNRGISGMQGGASSVTLPNGQQYVLTYDPAYAYIKTITYPSKAQVEYTWAVDPQSEVSGYQGNYTAGQPVSNTNQTCIYTIDMPRVQSRVVKVDGVTPALEQDFVYSTQWNTNYSTWGGSATWTKKTTTVTTKDLIRAGHPSFTTVYTYVPMANRGVVGASTTFPSPVLPVESTVAYYDTSGSLLRTVTKVWNTPNQLAAECVTLDNNQTAGAFYKYAQYSWGSVNSIANTSYSYFTNLVTDEAEYDYGTVVTPCRQPSSAPIRETQTTYASLGQTPYWRHAPAIVDRPYTVQVYGNGTLISETDYAYDGTALAPVSPAPYGHDETNYGPSASAWARGNATTITKKCFVGSTACTNSVWKIAYDTTGQPVSVTDAKGNITTISYVDSFVGGSGTPPQRTNQYATTITKPTTKGVSHIETFQWDYNQGELAVLNDENGKNSFFYYNDPWNRLTEADYPDGGVTKHAYVDSPPISVTTCELINGSASATCNATSAPTGWETNVALKDAVGHFVQADLSSDPDGTTNTTKTYDGSGRTYVVSNPYRTTVDPTYGTTTYTYDALGRVTQKSEPDGSVVTTSYTGNQTTVTDETGNQRKSQVDALGRITNVWEAPNNPSYNYQTTYTYDALDNLLSVVQNASRARTFTYDSLSRLVCAANPEVQIVTCPATGAAPFGVTTYAYDANSNPVTKVAPQPDQTGTSTATETTNYSYDELNRLTQKAYIGLATPTVQYGFDGTTLVGCGQAPPTVNSPTYLIGRRSSMCDGMSGSSWSFDAMGRPLTEARTTQGTVASQHSTGYTYNLDGSIKTLTYPSGDVVTYIQGGAGRPLGVSDSNNTYVVNRAEYAPHGALISMTNGSLAGIQSTNFYGNRLQPLLVSANSPGNPVQISTLTVTSCSGPYCMVTVNVANTAGIHVGDTVAIVGSVPPSVNVNSGVVASVGAGQVVVTSQSVGVRVGRTASGGTLDDVNNTYVYSLCYDFHLGVSVTGVSAGCGLGPYTSGDNGNVFQILNTDDTTRSAMFAYDPLNRLTQANTINTTSANCWTEVYTIDGWGNLTNRAGLSSMPTCMTEPLNAAPATAQNHLPGLLYDTAGNVLNDGIGNTPTHDAENRIVTDEGVTYSYDADGTRIEKSSGRMYWTGAGGEYLAESDLSGTVNEEYIYFNGERTARVDRPSGTVHYYFSDPLGSASVITDANGNVEEQYYYYPYGGLVSSVGGDPNHYKFTGKERDAESGLDEFGARYYASSLGRFMIPDWAAKPTNVPYASFGNPQSLNLYSYVNNNPTTTRDPDGHDTQDTLDPQAAQEAGNTFAGALTGLARMAVGTWNSVADLLNAQTGYGLQTLPMPQYENKDQAIAGAATQLGTVVYSAVEGATAGSAASGAEASGETAGKATQLQINKATGDAFRDEVAGSLKAAGRDVQTEVTKQTPFGTRRVDIEVSQNGKTLGGVETKTGNSPYKPSQRAKDTYLKQKGYPVNVVRKPKGQ